MSNIYFTEEFQEYALKHSPIEVANHFNKSVCAIYQAYHRFNIKHYIPKRKGNVSHNISHTIIYRTWKHIKGRCYCETNKAFYNYGGRGITVCKEWLDDPVAFYNWSIEHGWRKGLSLDRIDNNKGYSPNNCRWTNRKVQNNNKRNNIIVAYDDTVHTLKEWSDIYGVRYNTLYVRYIMRHWDFEKALRKKENNLTK